MVLDHYENVIAQHGFQGISSDGENIPDKIVAMMVHTNTLV